MLLKGDVKVTQNNKLNLLSEKFVNAETGQEIEGVTIMVDGKLKQALDIIINQSEEYTNYTEIIRDIIFIGTQKVAESIKK
ncbi:hypothetical protein AR543_17245 [Paenibacillus bovis]|uniref:Uncharacterized protein n=1 Tax=Paenibacillus bovis TaxID=1616788 RepID=A0A172ZKB2_9BACL|nr:hypothetical protein AR543_17245 [Paenibacillus bovis]